MPIETDIKSQILIIGGRPDQPDLLKGATKLKALAYTDLMCDKLANKLQDIADQYGTGKTVSPGSIDTDKSVNDCITMTGGQAS
ncbi:MAG: hypothetical protein JWP44_3774 [Mucilaginibacter sp.]|nr:hypothetical protein [Mucilaginibacter sp.]